MALPILTIAKNWFTGTNVREINWDNIRNPVVTWAAGINGGITQISRDAFGSSYVINQNGAAILSKSLQQQINEIGSGTTPFTGDVKIYSGFDLLMYSDLGTTLKFSIDGATGNAISRGNVSLYSGGDLAIFSDAGTTLKFAVDGATGNTFLYAGADFTVFSDAGITAKFFIDGATGNFGIPTGQRFYLDGVSLAGNTYLYESSADVLSSTAGGNRNFQVTANTVDVLSGADFSIADTKKLFLDGGTDTYITHSAANRISFFTGGTESFRIDAANIVKVLNSMNFSVMATSRLYLDDGGDTYITESAANVMDFRVGGTLAFTINGTGLITSSYEYSLPNIDPPSSFNYQTQSSGVKGYVWYEDGGTVESNYNIDSITDDDGDGVYDINWDRDAPATSGKTSICCTVTVNAPVGQDRIGQFAGNTAVGTTRIVIWDVSGAAPVDDSFTVTAFGG